MRILNLQRWYTPEDLEEAYRRQRDIFYPPMHEIFGKHDEKIVKEQMLNQMTSLDYVYPLENYSKGPSGREMAQQAFICFSDVCDAYHILKEDKDYTPYRLDAIDFDGYLEDRFGKAGGKLWKGLATFSRYALWLLIPLLVAWIAAGISEQLWIGWLATAVFAFFHWGVALRLNFSGFLLYIPKGLWEGLAFGAQYGFIITKLYSIIFCGLGWLIWWTIKFIFRPCLIIEDLEYGLGDKHHYVRRCRELVPLRYAQAKAQVEQFGQEHMADKVRKAQLTYAVISKWSEQARDSAVAEMLAEVKKESPQYEQTFARIRDDIFSLKSREHYLREEDRRAYKWIDWVNTDSYGVGPIWYYSYDEDGAMRMAEEHDEKVSGSYEHLDKLRAHYAMEAQIVNQRRLMDCCIKLYSLI